MFADLYLFNKMPVDTSLFYVIHITFVYMHKRL